MKLAILLITLSFLLFAFTTELSLVSDAETVVDINGDPLVPGAEYYIVSAISGPGGGGVRPGRTENSECPVSVIQEISDQNYGDPVKFAIPLTSLGIISPGTPLKIAFTKKPDCAESSNWVIARESNKKWLVIGGPEAHPNSELVSGHFKIGKVGSSRFIYKLMFCPRISTLCGSCSDVGRVIDEDGIRRLVLSDENTFRVVFVAKTAGK